MIDSMGYACQEDFQRNMNEFMSVNLKKVGVSRH